MPPLHLTVCASAPEASACATIIARLPVDTIRVTQLDYTDSTIERELRHHKVHIFWLSESDSARPETLHALQRVRDLEREDPYRLIILTGSDATTVRDILPDWQSAYRILPESSAANESIAAQLQVVLALANDASQHQGDVRLLVACGKAYYARQDFMAALPCFQQAVKMQPSPEHWYLVGITYKMLNLDDEALIAYERALTLQPTYGQAINAKSAVYYDQHDYKEALRLGELVCELEPTYGKFWYNRGNVLLKLQRYVEALAMYDEAIKYNLYDAESWSNRGVVYLHLHRYKEAYASFEQAYSLDSTDARFVYNIGHAHLELHRYELAIAAFHQAIALNLSKVEAWNNLGFALTKLGRDDEAIAALQEALRIDPQLPQARENIQMLMRRREQQMKNQFNQ